MNDPNPSRGKVRNDRKGKNLVLNGRMPASMFISKSASRSALFLFRLWLLSLQAFLSNVFGSNFEKPREGERVSMKYVCIVFLF